MMFSDDFYKVLGTVLFVFWLVFCALMMAGCVRSVTTCITYDHSLGRADPVSGLPRNSTGASVCTEMGPPQ
jgi:hypothetical protein